MGERQKHDWRIGDRDGDVRGSSAVDIYDESIFHRMVLVMNPSNVIIMDRKTQMKREFRRTRPRVKSKYRRDCCCYGYGSESGMRDCGGGGGSEGNTNIIPMTSGT